MNVRRRRNRFRFNLAFAILAFVALAWFLMLSPYGLAYIGIHGVGDAVWPIFKSILKDWSSAIGMLVLTVGILVVAGYAIKTAFIKKP